MGAGSTTLALPSMFAALGWKTLMVFARFNVGAIPLVYFFSANRSLEEINLLFSLNSPLVSASEREYKKLIAEAKGNAAVAERRLLDSVDAANNEKDAHVETAVRRGSVSHDAADDGDEKAVQYVEESKKSSIGGSSEE